jgi:hypothetical protein
MARNSFLCRVGGPQLLLDPPQLAQLLGERLPLPVQLQEDPHLAAQHQGSSACRGSPPRRLVALEEPLAVVRAGGDEE